jgi:hypothetical protein
MKRDMELMRRILFSIEEQYEPGGGSIWGLKVEGYDLATVAEHCDLLYQQGLVQTYKAQFGDDRIYAFAVGNLTAAGYDYLELVRNEDVWEKTKADLEEKKLPKTVEWIAKIAGIFAGNVVKELNT